jgi:hypothetical protein
MICLIVALLSFIVLPFHSAAFGPRLEPLKGGYGPRTKQFAISDCDEQDEHEHPSSTQHQVYTINYENQFEEIDGEVFRRSLFIAEPFILDSAMFGVNNPFDTPFQVANAIVDITDYDSCSGDDCDECSIPEEFKYVESPVDVMAYLGIKRVEPIRTAHQFRNWE